jgi:hypothetical protein
VSGQARAPGARQPGARSPCAKPTRDPLSTNEELFMASMNFSSFVACAALPAGAAGTLAAGDPS